VRRGVTRDLAALGDPDSFAEVVPGERAQVGHHPVFKQKGVRQGKRSWMYAQLIADENGCSTDSDDLYLMVHAAFAAHADGLTYIGFTRSGFPPDAPLFAMAMMYVAGIFVQVGVHSPLTRRRCS
jgi:hypothetical protein